MIRTTMIAAAALALGLSAARADYFDITEAVAGHPGGSYFDLARTIVPDLRIVDAHAVGGTAIELRYVDDLGDADEAPRPGPDIAIYNVEAMPIKVAGHSWMLMRADLGQAEDWATHIDVLSLFDESLHLVDAVNIGLDQMSEIRRLVEVSETDEAVLTYSEHFNSNQTYGSYALLLVGETGFRTIATFGLLSDRWCGHQRTQRLEVASTPQPGPGYWPLTVTAFDAQVQLAEDLVDGGCGDTAPEAPFETTNTARYDWNVPLGRYVTEHDDFARLGDINSERY